MQGWRQGIREAGRDGGTTEAGQKAGRKMIGIEAEIDLEVGRWRKGG